MKIFKIILSVFSLFISINAKSQTKWWGGITVEKIVKESELIFEGRILTDSAFFQKSPGEVWTYHKVVICKQFLGSFQSDTIGVVTTSGRMILDGVWQGSNSYAKVGDEAVFFVSQYQGALVPLYCAGVGYVTICDKKDVVKEVYEPIEKATGTPRIVLKKNSCEK
jgi:hypothetical protein